MRRCAYLAAVWVVAVLALSCGSKRALPPDFNVVAPSSLAFTTGSGTRETITSTQVVGENGFNSAITLTVAPLPAGLSVSLSPSTVPGPGLYEMTWTANNVNPGVYNITLVAVSGSLEHDYEITVTVEQ